MNNESFRNLAFIFGGICWAVLSALCIRGSLKEKNTENAIFFSIFLPLSCFFPALLYGLCFPISVPATLLGMLIWTHRKVFRRA